MSTSGRLFGTDGVRGLANRDLTAELALDLSVAAAHVLADAGEFAGHRPLAIVGRDGRASGEFLGAAVVAGLTSAGVDVLDAGRAAHAGHRVPGRPTSVPTSASMLSASHNPMPDNGIKFFARGGRQARRRRRGRHRGADARARGCVRPARTSAGSTRSRARRSGTCAHLLASLPHRLDGLRVVVDCANGAASRTAPEALRRAGADVIAIHAEPDGTNINDGCGSTHMESLRAAVLEHGADAGIAHDGDADRCLAVDAGGEVVDGDQILSVLSLALLDHGRLTESTVVATVMSNLGFSLAMQRAGVHVVQTAVGDRYVLEAMNARGLPLGGEQSGHVVMLEHATTGDGSLTALHLLARVAETGKPLGELAAVMQRLPQVLVNVPDVDRSRVAASARPSRRPSPRRTPSWPAPVGCSCARAARSRSCASWSRRRRRSRPARSRSDSPRPCGPKAERAGRPATGRTLGAMCGIVGYVGDQQALDVVVEGLRRLEYRGYDSAGVAVVAGGEVDSRKRAGKLGNLEKLLAENPMPPSGVGMGHTRWATHGAPNDRNAHPHLDATARVAVIHNGIIENFADAAAASSRRRATRCARTPTPRSSPTCSPTRTRRAGATSPRRCAGCAAGCDGAFTLVAVHADDPTVVVGARRNSPLVVGLRRRRELPRQRRGRVHRAHPRGDRARAGPGRRARAGTR